jgi:hypothetical protein
MWFVGIVLGIGMMFAVATLQEEDYTPLPAPQENEAIIDDGMPF